MISGGIFALILVIVITLFLLVIVAKRKVAPGLPYEARGPLLTPAELHFYQALRLAIPEDCVLTFKVRIGDVIRTRRGLDRKASLVMRAKIQQKHFDFVVCRQDMSIVCCIELNDSSHRRRDRIQRDRLVRSACRSAGIALIEYPTQRDYQVSDIRKAIIRRLNA